VSVDVEHFDLSDRKAIVLGADTPGGGAIARAYAEAGASVGVCVPEENAAALALRQDIEAFGVRCEILADRPSARDRTGEALRHAASVLGAIDIVASCPDLFFAKPIAETTDGEFETVMAANFGVQFAAARAAAREMQDTGGGSILLLSHVLGERGLPNTAVYGAANAATRGLVRSLARELGSDGITINSIQLGWMDWMHDRLRPGDEEADRAVRFTILKRAGRPEDVGPLAVWLAGSGTRFVTGQTFRVDGGLTAHL
jgi:3-oxoacyl-[acyl-carrier protein] reductase